MNNLTSLKNKVIIVTGASSGIGMAIALEAARQKAKVVLAARRISNLEEIVKNPAFIPGSYLLVQADVRNESDCSEIVNKTIQKFKQIDILVNNAGISMRALFEDVDLNVLKELMDVNFWGTVYCTKFALPYLLNSKGSIVGVSSIAGYKGLPGRTGYSASKFAMQGFLETLRIENLKKGLHVLIACPGFTASNIRNMALGKDGAAQKESPLDESNLMSAEEVASRIISATIKRKRSLIMTTQGKLTVILNKFFPYLLDKMVYNHMAKEENSPFK